MSNEKQVSQTTFREFLEKAKESYNTQVIEDIKNAILRACHFERATEENVIEGISHD